MSNVVCGIGPPGSSSNLRPGLRGDGGHGIPCGPAAGPAATKNEQMARICELILTAALLSPNVPKTARPRLGPPYPLSDEPPSPHVVTATPPNGTFFLVFGPAGRRGRAESTRMGGQGRARLSAALTWFSADGVWLNAADMWLSTADTWLNAAATRLSALCARHGGPCPTNATVGQRYNSDPPKGDTCFGFSWRGRSPA